MTVRYAHSIILVAMFLFVALGVSAEQRVDITSTGGADVRVAVAVPDFAAQAGLETVAKDMADVLTKDLVFTGIFSAVPREKYPSSFRGFTPNATEVDFEAWRQARVEYLIYGSVSQEGGNLVAECRMFDIKSSTQVAGQRLTAAQNLPRLIVHRFEEEVVRKVDGAPGMASSVICFSAGKTGNKEIFIADYDGANVRQVTKFSSVTIKPKFSPDGSKIAFVSYKDRFPFLYTMDVATGATRPLSKNVGLNSAPAWAPDGRRLAMSLSKDANAEIYIKNVDGSGERRLTNNPGCDSSPTFDPSGSRIAFVSDRGGVAQIYTMSASGGDAQRATYAGGQAYDPVWSPDGKRIAYVCDKSGAGLEIYMMDLSDGVTVQLTDSAGANESPSWSPDSRHVVFCSSRTGRSEIWVVNVRPPYEEHHIALNGMTCEGPYWGPRR